MSHLRPEWVSPKIRKLYKAVQEAEARLTLYPSRHLTQVSTIKRPRAVSSAAAMTRTPGGSPPTKREVDAVESVLAGAHSHPTDGYWREVSRAALEAAADARLAQFIEDVDAEFNRNLGEGRN